MVSTLCRAGFKKHSFALIVRVDDFMAAYSESFDAERLTSLFSWGSQTRVDVNTPGEYRGKEITMHLQDGRFIYKVSQSKFIKNMAPGHLKTGRLQQSLKMSVEEMQEFRSVCGSIQWLAGQSRPDLSSTASLCHRGSSTDVTDLFKSCTKLWIMPVQRTLTA